MSGRASINGQQRTSNRTSSSEAARGSSRLVDGGASRVLSSTSDRSALVGFPEVPSGVGGAAAGRSRTGESGASGALPDYDGAFEVTAWWSSADDRADNEGRSPFDLVPEEESDAAFNARKEMI